MKHFEQNQKRKGFSPENEEQMIQEKVAMNQKHWFKEVRSQTQIGRKKLDLTFNLGRMIPKSIKQDKEYLYSQNISLKEQNRELKDENLRLKTRLNVSEKQKQHLAGCFSFGEMELISSRPSQHRKVHAEKSNRIYEQNFARKMLRDSKDQMSKIKQELAHVKKSVKYTQISELKIQNLTAYEQCSRLEQIIASTLNAKNTNHHQLESQIFELKSNLQSEKESVKSLMLQARRKRQQNQELKSAMREEVEKVKLLTKKLNDMKKSNSHVKKTDEDRSGASSMLVCEGCAEKEFRIRQHLEEIQDLKLKLKLQISQKGDQRNEEGVKSKKQSKIKIQHEDDGESDEEDEIYNDEEFEENDQNQYQAHSDLNNLRHKKEDLIHDERSSRNDETILKDTITYRLMCQRYQYRDLKRDLSQSNSSLISVQQIANILSEEPFGLLEDQAQIILLNIVGDQNSIKSQVTVKTFLKKIEAYIGDFTLLPEDQENKVYQSIRMKVKGNYNKLAKAFESKSHSPHHSISRADFESILASFMFSSPEICLCLGEASLVSKDIEHINYHEALKALSENNS